MLYVYTYYMVYRDIHTYYYVNITGNLKILPYVRVSKVYIGNVDRSLQVYYRLDNKLSQKVTPKTK